MTESRTARNCDLTWKKLSSDLYKSVFTTISWYHIRVCQTYQIKIQSLVAVCLEIDKYTIDRSGMQKILTAKIGSSWPIKIDSSHSTTFTTAIIHHQSGLGEKKKWSVVL